VRYASRAWLSVPGEGEGLIISVALDDPASEAHHSAVIDALERACAAVPLRVPFPVDVTFSGEPVLTVIGEPISVDTSLDTRISGDASPGELISEETSRTTDLIDEWITRNTRPFYTRD
jgi:hypothetical protein